MPGGLSMGGLPKGGGPDRDRKQEKGFLRGLDMHHEESVNLGDLKRLLAEQSCRCYGCGKALPDPEFEHEIDDAKVFPGGPVLISVEEGGDHGTIDRRGRWFCLACGVNHPNGVAVRRIALRREWGYLLAWDTGSHPDWKALALEMHQAVADEAVSALTRLLVSGYKAGDIWTLHESDLNLLARNPRLKGFPLRRPLPLQERVLWSGSMLSEGVDHVTMKRLMEDGKVFLLLTSEALGMEKPLLAGAAMAEAVNASQVLDPSKGPRASESVAVAVAELEPEPDDELDIVHEPPPASHTPSAASMVGSIDPFNPVAVAVEPVVVSQQVVEAIAVSVEPETAAPPVSVAVEVAPAPAARTASPSTSVPADTTTPGEEILGMAGPPPGAVFDEELEDEPPE